MDFRPIAWTPPPAPPLAGVYERNRKLAAAELWPAGGAGPEDVVVDAEGRVWAGLADGRIVRWPAGGGTAETIASTGGRPLGLEIAPGGGLIVCDAAKGLLRLSPGGEIATLVDRFEGGRLLFTNNAAVAADGTIYFTDSSRRHPIERYKLELLEQSGTGRLFAHRPDGRTELLLDGLQFANGVALAPGEDYLLVAETARYRILRYRLAGGRRGTVEPFIENLPGFPDNLSSHDGLFWAALPSTRDRLLDAILPRPRLRHLVARLPDRLQPAPKRHGFVLGLDEAARVVHNLQDDSGRVAVVTGVRQHSDRLYLGSLTEPAIAVYDLAANPPRR